MPYQEQNLQNTLNPTPYNVAFPSQGTTFRAVGDNMQSTLYSVQNGQLVNLAQSQYKPQAIANTRFSVDGRVYEKGSYLDPLGANANVQWLEPGYAGTAYSLSSNVGDMYDRQYGAGAYQKLPTYNMADIEKAISSGTFQPGQTVSYNTKQNKLSPTIISSTSGRDTVTENAQRLQQLQSQYTFQDLPSGKVDILEGGKSISQGGPGGYDPAYAAKLGYTGALLPGGSPAQQKQTVDINAALAGGGLTAEQQNNLRALQQTADSITSAQAQAQQAYDSKDYSSMDKYMKFIEAQNKIYTDALSKYHQDVAPLRQQLTQSLVPGAKEQQIQQQLVNLKGQIEAFNTQTDEDRFRAFEGVTLQFGGGRASEIDIRAEFKRQRMANEYGNLLDQLGLEQDARKLQGQNAQLQLEMVADDFNLQQRVHEKLTQNEERLFDRIDTLDSEAKRRFADALDILGGTNPDELSPEAKKQFDSIIAQSGLPSQLVSEALRLDYQRKLAEQTTSGGQTGGISTNTQRILDGFGSIDSLTPSAKTEVENELYELGYGSQTPPAWFKKIKEEERQQTLTPEVLQQLWNQERNRVTSGGSSSSSPDDLFDSL